jgi:GT2 family glycosyltransferase
MTAPSVTAPSVTAPRVTAVVLNWCNEHDTIECLDSLKRQDYPVLTILLVDNGSPDGSGARLHARYPAISFLQTGENLGYAGGNNRGMKQALDDGADYVLVLNNDTALEESCVRELVQAARSEQVGAVGAKILRYDAPEKIWFGGGRFDRLRAIGRHERANQVDVDPAERQLLEATFLTGCCLLIPAATLRTVGYFRDDFFAYLEDVEFGLRIMKSGYRLLLAPAARLRHKVPPLGSLPSPSQIHLRDRNRRRIVRSHYSLFEALRFASWFYPARLALMVTYGLRGDAARVRGILRGMVEA